MWDIIRDWFEQVRKARTFPIVIIYAFLISVLVYRLFNLQIVSGEEYAEAGDTIKETKRYTKGNRGTIYDCNGVALAYNGTSYSVTLMDTGDLATNASKNKMIEKLLSILDKYECDVDIDFPIQQKKSGEYVFNVDENKVLNFKRDVYCVSNVKKLDKKQKEATAQDVYEFLKDTGAADNKFGISDSYDDKEALRIMGIRYEMFINRYQDDKTITIANNVDDYTKVAIKESSADLPGVDVTTDTFRKYASDYSVSMSHILGYTGTITEDEIASITNKKINSENLEDAASHAGYTTDDQIGKSGIEKEYEKYLHGECGSEEIKTNSAGKVLNISELVASSTGKDVYLTIDAELQQACYDMLEKELSQVLLQEIVQGKNSGSKGRASDKILIPEYDVYFALVNNNLVDITSLNDKTASDVEKSVHSAFTSKRKTVIKNLKRYLAVNSNVSKSDLSDEYEAYVDYLYAYMKTEKIILVDEVNESDKKFVAYTKKGSIGFSEFIQYAIGKSWIDLSVLDIGEDDYYSSSELYAKLLEYLIKEVKGEKDFSKKIYYYMIYDGTISPNKLCAILYEQGVLKYDEKQVETLLRGNRYTAYSFLRSKIRDLSITPAMLALDPCSGSVIVTDPKTGDVKACVSYPGYEVNKFANKIDVKYYYKLYEDKSYPMLFRATKSKSAPGSTYKPLVALAALSEGVVGYGTKIACHGSWQAEDISEGGKCWRLTGHGKLDVVGGIANSCNVFFYNVGYDFRQRASGSDSGGCKILAKYAKMFGFDSNSGIATDESAPQISERDAVKASIGQADNNYTPSQISRYATTLVNGSTCFDLNTVDYISKNGKKKKDIKAKKHGDINVSQSVLNTVYNGMYKVVNGQSSSIDQHFKELKDMNIQVAGKTGTAQESKLRPNHALFISFAPYNTNSADYKNKVCTTVVIQNGYNSANAAEVASNVYRWYFSDTKKEKKAIVKQAGSGAVAYGGTRSDG